VLAVPIAAVIGVLLGCASWVVAMKLTAGTRVSPCSRRGLLLLSGVFGAGVLALSTFRSGGNLTQVAVVALLAIPLLVTLLTDVLDRLIFPVVLVPGLLVALALAAAGSLSFPLPAALISGGGAAFVTALLVALSGWVWSGSDEPALGSGEILIAGTIGAMLGPDETLRVLFAGVLLAAVAGGLLLLTRRAHRHDVLPYGAFLCCAALVALAL
jgi:prepilin signal peptidase PulO-like enzyme (type II secretory pathway)